MAEETGKLIEKMPLASGVSKAGKQWSKLTFVIQVQNTKFPRQVAFDTMNAQLIQTVSDTSVDTNLRVQYDVTSRKWQGKDKNGQDKPPQWFSNVNAWRVEVVRDEGNEVIQASNILTEPQDDDSLPF